MSQMPFKKVSRHFCDLKVNSVWFPWDFSSLVPGRNILVIQVLLLKKWLIMS